MNTVERLEFRPFPGIFSPHLQTILSPFVPWGKPPPSTPLSIPLGEGDSLSCHVSTPSDWKESNSTVIFLHGLGGSHASHYLIRLARKFYLSGFQVIRLNLRGCGSGYGLSKKPYNGGNSEDLRLALEFFKQKYRMAPLTLITFSLGANAALKLAGEWGGGALPYLRHLIAVCPVLHLDETVKRIELPKYFFYHRFFLKALLNQSKQWKVNQNIPSIYAFDEQVTAPYWGYASADDYYAKCSSFQFLPSIKVPCDILLAEDDPFIHPEDLQDVQISSSTKLHLTAQGGHVGFLGYPNFYWMDDLLLTWAKKGLRSEREGRRTRD